MARTGSNGWNEWSNVVLKELDRLNDNYVEIDNKMDFIKTELTKVKAVWNSIEEFRESLIRKNDKDAIVETLFEYPGVAWISREEDLKLSKLGYQTKRPGGFFKCYEQAEIRLLNEFTYKKIKKLPNKT